MINKYYVTDILLPKTTVYNIQQSYMFRSIDNLQALVLTGQQTVNWKAQHVPIVVYMQCTSWWWATNMPETCRGWM